MTYIKNLYHLVMIVVNERDKEEFSRAMVKQNMDRLYPFSILTLILELFMLFRSIIFIVAQSAGVKTYYYMSLYISMIVMSCTMIILCHRFRKQSNGGKNTTWAKYIPPLSVIMCLLWGAIVSTLDLSGTFHQTTTYISMMYLLFVVILMQPRSSFGILLCIQIFFIVFSGICIPNADLDGYLVNSSLNAILAWMVSRVLYANAYLQFYSQKTILEQNSKLLNLNFELEQLSGTDPLTRIMNRRRFDEVSKLEWQRACRDQSYLTVAICDVDDFKLYNDHYGHLAGDDCLIQVAKSMKDELRRASDVVARYGGEEFVIMITGKDPDNAYKILENLRISIRNLKMEHIKSKVDQFVTVSIGGYCSIPEKETDVYKYVSQADKAMYMAKAGGKNKVVIKT